MISKVVIVRVFLSVFVFTVFLQNNIGYVKMSIYRGKTAKEVFLATLLYDALEDENVGLVCIF